MGFESTQVPLRRRLSVGVGLRLMSKMGSQGQLRAWGGLLTPFPWSLLGSGFRV